MKSLAAAFFTIIIVTSARAEARAEDNLSSHWSRPAQSTSEAVVTTDLYPESCSRCHPGQFQDWSGSLHSRSVGPGLVGQFNPRQDPAFAASCYYCHAPLVEQAEVMPSGNGYAENPLFDKKLKNSGVSCGACHVREGVVYGPVAPQDVPKAEGTRHSTREAGFFSRAAFCAACHQLEGGFSLGGKPLTNTYREWEASPYGASGVACQTCHMPGRKHLFRGIHDPEMTRSGATIEAEMLPGGETGGGGGGGGGRVSARLKIKNTGAGHMLPTYVTPSIVVRGFMTEPGGEPIAGTVEERVIGRRVAVDLSRELFDTRIAPGATFRFDYDRERPGGAGGAGGAEKLVLEVWVHPDEFYNRFFSTMLSGAAPGEKPLLEEALGATEASVYLLFREEFPLAQ